MKNRNTIRLLVAAAILLASGQTFAQTIINYRCRQPNTGSLAVAYNWYICWPDSNTLTLETTTRDTFADIMHERNGERVRVVAVDALDRVGPWSAASAAWALIVPTGSPPATALQLHPVYPNPFNPRTTVAFDLPESQRARVAIYSLDGQLVAVLADAQLSAGKHALVWAGVDANGQTVASGVYICRLESAGRTQSVRMSLVR